MKASYPIGLAFCIAIAHLAYGADGFRLEPNATLRLDFPDLPDTLATVASGERQPAHLTATFPTNYTREGKFPLFIFLNGGDGGRGDGLPVPRQQVVPRDLICVSLPLFKHAYHTN